MSIFDQLDDESEPSVGVEIGQAVSIAIDKLGKTNQALIAALSKSMVEAMKNQPQPPTQKAVLHWEFAVKRDERGFMTSITATAQRTDR